MSVVSLFERAGVDYLILFHEKLHVDGTIRNWEFEIQRQSHFGCSGGLQGSVFGTLLYDDIPCYIRSKQTDTEYSEFSGSMNTRSQSQILLSTTPALDLVQS